MRKFLTIVTLVFSLFLFSNVNAEVVKVNLSELKFNNINLLDLSYYNIPEGNRTLYFDFDFSSTNENATIFYNSIVLCSDAQYTSAYATDPSEVTNIRMNNTSYSCNYSNSSYTGGKVVIITFATYSSGANSIVLYQNANASVQLIDFAVDTSGYVNPINYSSQTLINQNSQIINQNNTIINNQEDIKNNTEDIKDTLKDDNIDTSKSNSFFSNFTDEDNGGISGVVTAPLRFIRKITNTCTPFTLKVMEQDVTLPCGNTLFWDKPEVATFKTTWNALVGGAILYALVVKLFKVISDLKNPDSSKVEVLDL